MKGKVKFVVTALMLAVFVATFAVEALAANKPNWVTVKYTGAFMRTTKNTKNTDGNHRSLVLKFDIINNSKDGRIMTAIYDRTISWNGVLTINGLVPEAMDLSLHPKYRYKPASWNVKFSMNGTNPYKGEWYPGQVYKYEHIIPLKSLIKPYNGDWVKTNEQSKEKPGFKLDKWSLDFQVSSKK